MKAKVFCAVCALTVFFSMSFAGVVYSGQEQSLSGFKQWVGKSPFDKVGGVKLFDTKMFKGALQKNAPKKIYDCFIDAYNNGGRYFGSETIKEKNGVIEIYVQDLIVNFTAMFYVDTTMNTFSFCWNDKNAAEKKFFYPDGTTANLNMDCDEISYVDMQKRKK